MVVLEKASRTIEMCQSISGSMKIKNYSDTNDTLFRIFKPGYPKYLVYLDIMKT